MNYILSTWKGTSRQVPHAAAQDWEDFKEDKERIIEALLKTCTTTVAAYQADDDVVAGWCCGKGNVLHYVFVRNKWKKNGIETELLRPYLKLPRVYVTDWPVEPGLRATNKWPPGFRYRPLYGLIPMVEPVFVKEAA